MDERTYVRQMLAEREANRFTTTVTELTTAHLHPHGPAVRITLTALDGDQDLGHVDIDITNLWALTQSATTRTTKPTASPVINSRPKLRLLGGDR